MLQLILHWFDSSTVKDIRECMKKTTWRLHSNKKRRQQRVDDTDQLTAPKNTRTGEKVVYN